MILRMSKTPLRVSLLGGGTDLPDFYDHDPAGGAVLSAAITQYVRVIVKSRPDSLVRLGYSVAESAGRLDDLKHELLREVIRYAHTLAGTPTTGIEIVTIGDVPQGTGLGSSSAVTAGTLRALIPTLQGRALAEAAYHVERILCGKTLGRQDQYASAVGGLNLIEFRPNAVMLERVAFEAALEFRQRLMLFRVGGEREAESILVKQRAAIQDRLAQLRQLRELAVSGYAAIQGGRYDAVGEMMHTGWELKKRLAEGITNGRIDGVYQAARCAGALGGKVCGAGGGGYLLLYVPVQAQNRVRAAMSERSCRELVFDIDWVGSRIVHEER